MTRPLIPAVILAAVTTAILVTGLIWVALATWHPRHATDPQEQRFLQWETCVLNDGQHCGPQPVP